MKKSPASRRPSPSEPSTKLYPRRRIAVPEFVGCARKTCEVFGMAKSPSTCLVKSTGSNSPDWPSGAPAFFVRPIVCSCSASVEVSQGSIRIRIRRVTTYDPPASQSAPGSSSATQTNWSSALGASALRLSVPSLNPNRLRGVSCALDVDDVRPKPSCDQRTLTTPAPSRTRFRIACTATWGSLAQACTHRSPPLIAGSIASPGKSGSSLSGAGRRAAMPNRSTPSAVLNRVGPKPTVSVRPLAGRPSASPVSSGTSYWPPSTAPTSPASCPAVIRRAAAVQVCSISTSSARSSVMTSKATKCNRSCAGVTIPAWCTPVNGTASVAAGAAEAVGSSAVARPITPPAAPAAITPAVPAPARPKKRRRDRPPGRASVLMQVQDSLPCDDRGHLADRLGQGGDAVTQAAQLLVGQLVVRRPTVTRSVLFQLRLGRGEPLVDLADQVRVRLLQVRAQGLHGRLRALEVGPEVPQVGVRVAVLLAGDLPGGDLVEQALGTVGQLQRVQRDVVGLGGDLLHVGQQLVGVRAHGRDVAGLPQRLLDPVEPGEVLALGLVALAAVDDRVQVAEALRDRLDPLPVGAGDGEQLLRALDVATLDRGHELGGLLDQRTRLALHVALVVSAGLGQRLVVVQRRGLAGDLQRRADAVADHARLAGGLVVTGRQLDPQLAGDAGSDVLDLVHHPVAIGVDEELGDLAAGVGDGELVHAGLQLAGGDVAAVVGGGHRDVVGGGLRAARGGGVAASAGGQRERGQAGEADQREALTRGLRHAAGSPRRRWEPAATGRRSASCERGGGT